ncbi:hypothetical protein K4G86_24550, partial [Mycobacterium tuberculosis]|nr:hypothetical protein [Mycobacterium tuberculosis]
IETILGGTAIDLVTSAVAENGIFVDLGAGNDRYTFSDFGGTVTTANVETIVGSTASDVLTLAGSAAGVSISLGAGND